MVVERLFLAVPQGCLRFVIVIFPGHTHLLFLCLSLFKYALFCVFSNFAIKLKRKRGFVIVREPVIGLIKWLRPKSLKVCSYVEKCAEFKN